jgi:L-malate glycosyltransferase
MRILHIISGDLWAGAEVQVFNTLLALHKEKDVNVLCVVFNQDLLFNKLKEHDIDCVIIDEMKCNSFRMLVQLIITVHKFKPTIIHTHRNKEHFLGACAAIISKRKIPVIRTVHGLIGVPQSLPFLKRFRSTIIWKIDTLLIKYMADALIAVSMNVRDIFTALRPKGKIILIYNSIDLNYINHQSVEGDPRSSYGIGNDFWIGTAVRLVMVKNIPMLIRSGQALARNDIRFRISIFGDGPLKAELDSLISDLDLQGKITVLPFEQNILPIIRSFDVFVLCSRHEGMPMSLLEAMALERPVVCTAVGGMKEIIRNGINGLLVSDNDHCALADALTKLNKEKDFAKILGINAGKTIKNAFTITHATQQLLAVYNSFQK